MIPVEALLFDLDGTLIDSKRDLTYSIQNLQKRLGFPLSTENQIASFIGDGVVMLVARALPGLKGPRLTQAVDLFKRHYRQHCLDHTRLYAGVREVLWHFRAKKLAVVTNKPIRISRHVLEGLGVLSRFQVVLGGDSTRIKKPDPFPIQYALRVLKISDPRRAVMIGDGFHDILAGRTAGTYTCGFVSNIGDSAALRSTRPDFLILKTHELMRLFN